MVTLLEVSGVVLLKVSVPSGEVRKKGNGAKMLLMNGSCAWWVSGPSLFNHLGLW